jgi:flagellar hook-basal body complex protein FliE
LAVDIASISTVGQALSRGESIARTASPTEGFARILGQYLGGISQQQMQAQQAVQDFALGRTDSLHQTVLQVNRADMAFRMFLEIRNRLSDAYQEIMKMSV